ncbi:MAG: TrmH family RNA methyltransferase, partial [Micromonosporaceae bacterium]
MPGNSQPHSRRTSSKKPRSVGSGGQRRQGLAGRGRTLPADERPWHKAYSGEDVPKRTAWKQEKDRRKAAAEGHPRTPGKRGPRRGDPGRPGGRRAASEEAVELLVGRNPVVEALRAHVPCTALYVAQRMDLDDRVSEAVRIAGDRGVPILEVSRSELDRLCHGALHQGLGLQVPPFQYEAFDDVLSTALESPASAPLLVALDGVTDPRNLGAVVRSAAAFGAHGVFLPERRSASMTATAWRASAGAASRLPIARVVNLTRSIKACQQEGFVVVGLDADG